MRKAELRPCLKFPSGLEHAFEAHADHERRGEQGHGSRGGEAPLVVDAQAPIALQAAERLLDLVGPSSPPGRVDLRFGQDEAGEGYVLTKQEGRGRRLRAA